MKNEVTIPLNDYLELRDFKKEIKANKTLRLFFHGYTNEVYYHDYITTDRAVKSIIDANHGLNEVITELQNDITLLKYPMAKHKTVKDISKFSIFQFLKWKRNIIR